MFHISELIDIKSFLLLLSIVLLVYYIKTKPPKNFPPGPWSLPFIGDWHHIDFNRVHLQFVELAGKYGRIFSVKAFGPRAVVLNGHKLVRQAYVNQGEDFVDRPSLPMSADIIGDKGLIMANGYAWKQQRKFALHTLRRFGLGNRSLQPSILQECRYLNEAIANEQGNAFDPHWLINNAVSNIICVLVFGERFEYSNDDFQSLLKNINEIFLLQGGAWPQLYNMFPWIMRRVPGPHRKLFSLLNGVIGFVRRKIEDHRVDLDPSNPRDYIDCFLGEMEKWKDDEASGYNRENLCYCTLDLFVAGTETTSTTLYWGLLYMIRNPEIQRKVQEELDRVVGSSRQPSLSDRENLPYTDAVLHETQRIGNVLPLNLPRSTTKDTQVDNYIIPKGTAVVGSLNSVLFDETEWETPHTFNPGHFLDAKGKFRRREAFLPFSIGKRVCLGEQLARMNLFLFFASLLHQFSFSSSEGVQPSLEFRLGFTRSPLPSQLCAVPR
ncbi:cytochrome P450 2J2-like [Alosa sapidissima]|uniref:cytochrome P450 2J2-like n=1 Tax=Alosa sapidissima TaxID=34773 RepID=UPI001C0A3FA4|nr:cytochrome P450 2J2-like [Alosa sapidissima]